MKTYEITIEPEIFTNDFPTINKTIQVKRINPKAIFKEYYDLDVIDIKKYNKYCYYIKAGYELFRLTIFPF